MEKEIVIKIGDKLYDLIKHYERSIEIIEEENDTLEIALMRAVIKGTPLPKGHGRLIDADELYGDFIDGTEGYDCNTWNRIEIGDIIEDAPTIMEADKEGEES